MTDETFTKEQGDEIIAAVLEGSQAARDRLGITANPYKSSTSLTKIGTAKYKAWFDGYLTNKGYEIHEE